MQVLNYVAVVLALLFLVPGYIIHSIISATTVRRQDDTQLLALRFLTFSTLNALLCAPFLLHLKKDYPDKIYLPANWWIIACILFVVPTATGAAIAFIEDRDILRWLFRRVGISLLHLSPSAWDTRFKFVTKNSSKQGIYAIVTLTDSRTIYGYFGDTSAASSDTKERDLFLQRLYLPDALGEWIPVPNSAGILISGTTIGSIEFRRGSQCQKTTIPRFLLLPLLPPGMPF